MDWIERMQSMIVESQMLSGVMELRLHSLADPELYGDSVYEDHVVRWSLRSRPKELVKRKRLLKPAAWDAKYG